MKKRRKVVSLVLALSLVVNAPCVFAAGWVDDWVSQKTSSGPNYYSGQQRGYATAGGFNARWKSGMDYPISIQPPKFSAGCGGIDFFAGSISMLNMDMLVAKLQRILQNSAGIAFNMALETVCPKCANIMNVMEQMSNQLNGMGMNDCSMAKGMTVALKDAGKAAIDSYNEGTLGTSTEKGLSDGYEYAKRELTAADGSSVKKGLDWLNTKMATPATKDPLNSGCPTDAIDIFPDVLSGAKVYLLNVIGTKLGMPTSHTEAMRGLVGDIVISGADFGYNVSVIPACSENGANGPDPDAIKEGFVYAKDAAGGACYKITDTNSDLVTYVTTAMTNVSTKMKNKTAFAAGPPTDPDELFIMNSPLPVAYALKVGIASGQESVIISNLAGITATALSLKSMSELVSRIGQIMQVAQEQNAKVMNKKDDCMVSINVEKLNAAQKELDSRVQVVGKALSQQMTDQMTQYSQVVTVVQQLENMSRQIEQNLASRFGASVAARAMK